MPKYLLLKHYRGGPEPHRLHAPDQTSWAPEDVEAHMAFLKHVSQLLAGERRVRRRPGALRRRAPGCATAAPDQ